MNKFPIHHLICLECGKSFPIPRVKNRRPINHIKTIFCPYCDKSTSHIENIDINKMDDDLKDKYLKIRYKDE